MEDERYGIFRLSEPSPENFMDGRQFLYIGFVHSEAEAADLAEQYRNEHHITVFVVPMRAFQP